jgi:hypothetical protein
MPGNLHAYFLFIGSFTDGAKDNWHFTKDD